MNIMQIGENLIEITDKLLSDAYRKGLSINNIAYLFELENEEVYLRIKEYRKRIKQIRIAQD